MNKEVLKAYNERLNINNISLDDILTSINELPEYKEVVLQYKEITPTKEIQNVVADDAYDGLSEVKVNQIPDEYIIPNGTLDVSSNGDVDVTLFKTARVGVYVPPNLQSKEVTPTKELQTITSDDGYDGLNEVTIGPIPDDYIEPIGTLEITENGEHNVREFEKVSVSITGSDSTPTAINVFVQEEEPEIKDGIWFQVSAPHTPDVELASFSTIELAWGETTTLPANNAEIGVAAIGTDMYLVGGNPNGANVYKFDTLTNTLTQLSNLPYSAYGIGVTSYGTDLYIFGGRPTSGTKAYGYAYKYDTLSDTYTQLTSMPYISGQTPIVRKGTDIYLIGGHTGSGVHANMYKYNILTDTYTKLTDLPSGRNAASTILYKNDIYILGGYRSVNLKEMWKYSINDNTYTRLSDSPYAAYGTAAGLYSRYIVFATGASSKLAYAYSIPTDTYIPLPEIASGRQRTSGIVIGDKFYVVGGTSNKDITVGALSNEVNEYENERDTTVVIPGSYNKNRTLLSNSNCDTYINVGDAYYYSTTRGVDYTIPIHIGNGTNWIEL